MSLNKPRNHLWSCLFVLLLSVLAVVAKSKVKKFDTNKYLDLCLQQPRLSSGRDHKALQWLLQTSGERSISSSTSHQHKAACWMLHQDKKKPSPGSKQFRQRFGLAVLFFATQGDVYWDLKTNWMSKKSECEWFGIECSYSGSVIEINLGFNKLNGILPRELGLIKDVVEVDFHGNDLQGVIPHLLMHHWTKCKILRLHMNGFFGSLHTEIGYMKSLEELHIFGNYFAGNLPTELASLKKLSKLDIYANAFEGTIPTHLGSLNKLKELDVHDNFFVGKVPNEICDRKMKFLVADCLDGAHKEVGCTCCTICCEGLPNMRCVDQQTKEQVIVGMQ